MVSASREAVTPQARWLSPPRSPTIVGRAVATIVWSIAASNMPSMIPEKMTSTWRFGSPVPGGAVVSIAVTSEKCGLRKVADHATLRQVQLFPRSDPASQDGSVDRLAHLPPRRRQGGSDTPGRRRGQMGDDAHPVRPLVLQRDLHPQVLAGVAVVQDRHRPRHAGLCVAP